MWGALPSIVVRVLRTEQVERVGHGNKKKKTTQNYDVNAAALVLLK